MENMGRKKKNKNNNAIGDDQYIGGRKENRDDVVCCENDVDNLEAKKKRKKKKVKGSKEERDGYAPSGCENEGGELEIGGLDAKNGVTSEVLGQDGESKKHKKKKKEKEPRNRKKRDESQNSGSDVENQKSVNYFCETDIGSSDGKERGKGEVLGEQAVELKAKMRKKENSSSLCEGDEQGSDANIIEKVEKKKRKRKEGQSQNDLGIVTIPDAICAEEDIKKDSKKKKRKREKETTEDDLRGVVVTAESLDKEILEELGSKKRKKEGKNGETKIKRKGKEKKVKISENTNGKKGKKVSFSNQVDVFPLSSDSRNKRFSAEEDKILLEAVDNYIEEKGLGEEGLQMVRNCRSHPKVKGCWDEIAKALPNRPRSAVYWRAHIILDRGEKRRWSEEDCELLRKLHEQHGNQWKLMAEEFGRNRYHVKNTWRRLKVIEKQKGRWTQQEYQSLFDLVNTDIRLKISEDEQRRSKYGMLRDNIHWTAISDTLSSRSAPNCCMKWYGQLSSPMVTQGLWADSDDYRLISELFSVDASCMEDVDWDNLLDHRSDDLCRMRWNQMVLHIGNHVSKSFTEQVEILARRYCPDMIEVREAWENKPYVD